MLSGNISEDFAKTAWFELGWGAIPCGFEQVTFTPCLVLVKPRKQWTYNRLGQTVTRLETMLCLLCCPTSQKISRRLPGLNPGRGAIPCGFEQVTFTPCLVLVKPRKQWTYNRLGQTVTRLETMLCLMCCPRDLVSRPDNMDETVPHTKRLRFFKNM